MIAISKNFHHFIKYFLNIFASLIIHPLSFLRSIIHCCSKLFSIFLHLSSTKSTHHDINMQNIHIRYLPCHGKRYGKFQINNLLKKKWKVHNEKIFHRSLNVHSISAPWYSIIQGNLNVSYYPYKSNRLFGYCKKKKKKNFRDKLF